jgi:hypothetical protein
MAGLGYSGTSDSPAPREYFKITSALVADKKASVWLEASPF